jgi:hypothetical protein
MLLKGIIVFIHPYIFKELNVYVYDFAFSFEIGAQAERYSNEENYVVVRNLIYLFIWELILTYCLYLQKKILNPDYSMKK